MLGIAGSFLQVQWSLRGIYQWLKHGNEQVVTTFCYFRKATFIYNFKNLLTTAKTVLWPFLSETMLIVLLMQHHFQNASICLKQEKGKNRENFVKTCI